MPQQELLHLYECSDRVKQLLAYAVSKGLNPRNLESNYTPAWISTFTDIIHFSYRLSIATEPTLTIPGKLVKQREIINGFAEYEKKQKAFSREIALLAEGTGKSVRISDSNKTRILQMEQDLADQENKLYVDQMTNAYKPDSNKMVNADWSFDSADPKCEDELSKDVKPDFKISHVIGGTFQMMTQLDEIREILHHRSPNVSDEELKEDLLHHQQEYKDRSGIKIVHECYVFIGEIKKAPKRFRGRSTIDAEPEPDDADKDKNDSEDEHDRGNSHSNAEANAPMDKSTSQVFIPAAVTIEDAIDDVMMYVSAYFAGRTWAKSVVAFVAAGPYWKWTTIARNKAVGYDWSTQELDVNSKNIKKMENFIASFGTDVYLLGSPTSDKQLDAMKKQISQIANECARRTCNHEKVPTKHGFTILADAPHRPYAPAAEH